MEYMAIFKSKLRRIHGLESKLHKFTCENLTIRGRVIRKSAGGYQEVAKKKCDQLCPRVMRGSNR